MSQHRRPIISQHCRIFCAAVAIAMVPAQHAAALAFVDTTPPVLTVPGATTLPTPSPTYEQPVYVFDLQTAGGVSGIVTNPTVNVTDDSGNTNWTPTGQMGPFAPGAHTVIWKATDLGLNSDTKTQIVTVLPHVNLAVDQVKGDGGAVTVTALLNGAAPANIAIPLTVTTNTSAPNTAAACQGNPAFTILAGDSSGSCTFTIGPNASAGTITFTLGALDPTKAIAGTKTTHAVTITTANLPPVVTELAASQGGGTTRTIIATAAAGSVSVTSTISDPNLADTTFTYDWSGSDASLLAANTNGTSSNTFIFNPTGLTAGFYTVKLIVSDSHGASSQRDLMLSVVAAAPTLSTTLDTDDDNSKDNVDGYGDSDNDGIPNYLDAVSASNLLQGTDLITFVAGLSDSRDNVSDNLLISWNITSAASNKVYYPLLLRTDPGLQLKLGPLAFRLGVYEAHISSAAAISALGVSPGAGLISADGTLVDVEIAAAGPGATVHLVIPQPAPIPPATGTPATTNFKLFTASNTWNDFTSSGNDSVKSAAKTKSYCPPAAHSAYVAGSLGNAECVELTITDGGPNDSDGLVNGVVRVTGAVFISSSDTSSSTTLITTPGDISASSQPGTKNDAGKGGGGIGALWWEILLLVPLLRRRG